MGEIWGVAYLIGVLVICLIGGRIYKKEIAQSHTDTGSGVLVVAVLWPIIAGFFLLILLPFAGIGWLVNKGNEINIGSK